MVGALIGQGLCNLGIHKGDSWTYRESNLEGQPASRRKNGWWWAELAQPFKGDVCIQDGVCQRCGAKCNRLVHDYGGGFCTRCGEQEPPEAYSSG